MVKKLLFIMFIFSFFTIIPSIETYASVRDSFNLRRNPFIIGDTFPNNNPPSITADTSFTSFKFASTGLNTFVNDQNVKATFIQLYIPFHPNITIVNCSKVSQFGCTVQFPSVITLLGNNESKTISLRDHYSFTEITVGDNTNFKGDMGFSTVIEVPRNFFDFSIQIISDLENNANDDAIKPVLKELLDREMEVFIVSDPAIESNFFNAFTFNANDLISSNNVIPPTAIKEMIIFIDPRFSARYNNPNLSKINFLNANNQILKTVFFSQATYTRTGNVKGYYLFNLDDVDINNAVKFSMFIRLAATTSISTEIPLIQNSFFYNFDDDIYYATFQDGLNVIKRQPFSILIPSEDFELPQGHSGWRWNDPDTGVIDQFDISYAPQQNITLFNFSSSKLVVEPVVSDILGGSNTPFDTILLNTGFLNPAGLMFIYFSLIVAIAFLSFNFKLDNLITIILNVLLTSVFLILGYLPFFVSLILISFYIMAFISINKGGFLNE